MISLLMCFDAKDKDAIVEALKAIDKDNIFGAWYVPPKIKIADKNMIEEDIDVQVSIDAPVAENETMMLHDAADIAGAYILGFISGAKAVQNKEKQNV